MQKRILIKKLLVCTAVVLSLLGFFKTDTKAGSRDIPIDFSITKNLIEVFDKRFENGVEYSLVNPSDNMEAFAYLHQNLVDSWGEYSGILISLENMGNWPLRINLNIQTRENQYKIGDQVKIVFEGQNEKLSLHTCENGSLEISAGTSVEIYVPFSGFVNEGTNEFSDEFLQSQIIGFGITLLPLENSEGNVTLKKILLYDSEIWNKYRSYSNIELMGRDSVPVPILGESVYPYELRGVNENISVNFYLKEDYEGVSIDNTGLLSITTDVTEERIVLKAEVDDILEFEMPIKLTRWVLADKTIEDGTPYTILPPEKSVSVNASSEILQMQKYAPFVRWVLIGCCVVFFAMYQCWRQKYKLDSNKK